MKRATYRPHELRAGMTVFFGGCNYASPLAEAEVAEFLIADNGPEPKEGSLLPYRISRDMATHLATTIPLHRSRRAAWRTAKALSAKSRHPHQ